LGERCYVYFETAVGGSSGLLKFLESCLPGSRSASEYVYFILFPTSTWNLENTHYNNRFDEDLRVISDNRKTINGLKRREVNIVAFQEI